MESGITSSSRDAESDTISASRPSRVTVRVWTTVPASTKPSAGDQPPWKLAATINNPPNAAPASIRRRNHEEQQEEDEHQTRCDQDRHGAAVKDGRHGVLQTAVETLKRHRYPRRLTQPRRRTLRQLYQQAMNDADEDAQQEIAADQRVLQPARETRLHAMSVSGQRRLTSGSSAM